MNMAEEHVVIPKERYQRMLAQLRELSNREHESHVSKQDKTIDNEDNEEEKFPENEGRTRDDVLLENNSETIIGQPPGITPKELNNLTVKAKKVKSMKVSKKGTVDNIVKRVSRSRKTTPKSRDIFKTIKKNWLSI